MNDRRRVNGPSGGTLPPLFTNDIQQSSTNFTKQPSRTRSSNTLRKMYLKTGVTPSASGSAFLELESHSSYPAIPTIPITSGLKLICTVHGPRPLPRSAPFSPHIILSTHVKHAPFANRQRRGYVRDSNERDLAVHLETALRGVIIGDRWPKSGVEVIVTVLEGEEDYWSGNGSCLAQNFGSAGAGQWGMMSVLSGCITVASAAIADAGIDCVDMVSGGIAALVQQSSPSTDNSHLAPQSLCRVVLDPVPSEHSEILALCVVGYLPSRDEITDVWFRGGLRNSLMGGPLEGNLYYEELADSAIQAALGSYRVLAATIKEATDMRLKR